MLIVDVDSVCVYLAGAVEGGDSPQPHLLISITTDVPLVCSNGNVGGS